jgi:DNA-binding NtrC family response regulator
MENPFESRPRIFVIVIDDELDIAKLLVVILQMNLFDAIPYSDPLIALNAAKATPPDYLISDIVMPGMSGIELAIAIQREVPKCKVLLFSGQIGASELIAAAIEQGHSFELVRSRSIQRGWWKRYGSCSQHHFAYRRSITVG